MPCYYGGAMDIVQDDMQIRKQKILSDFDFNKVHKVMKSMQWKWGDSIPTISQIKEQAISLLEQVINRPSGTTISCGGFTASKHGEILGLIFSIESKRIYKFGEDYVSC